MMKESRLHWFRFTNYGNLLISLNSAGKLPLCRIFGALTAESQPPIQKISFYTHFILAGDAGAEE
jgi:hypothetical protein